MFNQFLYDKNQAHRYRYMTFDKDLYHKISIGSKKSHCKTFSRVHLQRKRKEILFIIASIASIAITTIIVIFIGNLYRNDIDNNVRICTMYSIIIYLFIMLLYSNIDK